MHALQVESQVHMWQVQHQTIYIDVTCDKSESAVLVIVV